MSCYKPAYLVVIVGLFATATSGLAQTEVKPPARVPDSEIQELLKHNPHEFEFTVKQGQKTIGGTTIISPKSGGYAIDSKDKSPKDIKLPPSHGCDVTVLSRHGDDLKLKISIQRTVGLKVTGTIAKWDTQNYTSVQRVTLGAATTLAIAADDASGAGPMEVTLVVRRYVPKLSQR
jgi:hypothetical protein